MKRILFGISLCLLAAGPGAGAASAQIYNMPVFFSPNFGTGVALFGDVGVGLSEDAELVPGETPWAAGGRVYVGTPLVHVAGGAAYVEPSAPDSISFRGSVSFGGNVALMLFRSPTSFIAVSLQGGAGYVNFSDVETKYLDFPIGIGVALNAPAPSVSVEPWLGVRAHVRSTTVGAGSPALGGGLTQDDFGTQFGFGLSGGITLGLPSGLGIWSALDWMTIKPYSGASESASHFLLGGGLLWKFRVPSLGIPGGLMGR
jgi:hypothetical protein